MKSLSGKTILITGSTDGLGKLIARHLAMRDAIVLLHGRNKEKGDSVLNELKTLTGNNNINYYNGDYSSLEEVEKLSENILSDHALIDILINNVGIGKGKKREMTSDGIEMRFGVNYLSHVLLTEKLIPSLKTQSSVIINVASVGQEPLDFNNLMLEKGYDGFYAYKQSKTALIMYSFDLADRLNKKGIKVNAVHPASLMNTKIVFADWGHTLSTVEDGAEAVENLLSSDITGAYYDGKQVTNAILQTYDPEARAKLREVTKSLLRNFIAFNE